MAIVILHSSLLGYCGVHWLVFPNPGPARSDRGLTLAHPLQAPVMAEDKSLPSPRCTVKEPTITP
ncbi:hypothetical protein J4Q44_G00260990 [Coregonus suidteri]|uniref:Uncharacterized protein n=1 Tax=Coregonus suidteri TaxID=861788 RepID=A0AAN8L7J8_9TELE